MAWEMRGTAGPYFYHSVRRGKRVLREYYGKGFAAQMAAYKVEQQQADRLAERQAILDEMTKAQPVMMLADEIDAATKSLFEASMLVAGFHRLNHGQWRKKRGIEHDNENVVRADDTGGADRVTIPDRSSKNRRSNSAAQAAGIP